MQTQFPLSVREARAVRGALTELLCSTAGDRGDAEVRRERAIVERLIARMDRRFGSAIQWSPRLG
jgi:hypothetical protein